MAISQLTRHAIQRMGQRGFQEDDLELIQLIGTEVESGVIVLNRDYLAAEHELKRLQERIRRLVGKRLVVADGRVITAYRASKATERRLVRQSGDRDLVT
jgi:hypothetical protein